MGKPLKVSEARRRLFDLVDAVTSQDAEAILIEHRDREERAVLISEGYLRHLHATIAGLRAGRAQEFRLEGTLSLGTGVEAEDLEGAIERMRAEHAVHGAARASEL